MKTRAITSIIIAVFYTFILSLAIFVHEIFFDIFILLIMIVASMEMSHAIAKKFSKPLDLFVLLYIIIGYIAFYLSNKTFGYDVGMAAYFLTLGLVFLSALVFSMFSKRFTMRNVISTMLVILYPLTILIYSLGLNYIPGGGNAYVAAILLLVIVSAMTDTFAYLIGVTIKGPKLCPAISPKKTISGAVGGLFGGLFGASVVLLLSVFGLCNVPQLSGSAVLNILHFMILGAFGSVFTQIGDLVASYVKRQCDIKDFGKFLPGHGGIMDRIDGMMLNGIFIYLYMIILAYWI